MPCSCPGPVQNETVEPAEYDLMDAAEDGMWWYRALHAHVIATLAKAPGLGPGCRVLDAGCGTGGLLMRLRQALPGMAATGLEYFPAAAPRAPPPSPVPRSPSAR